MDNEAFVRRYAEAVAANDFEALGAARHPDWYEDWPQSGERIPNHEAYRRIHEDFPSGMPSIDVRGVAGAEDRWVVTPSMTIQRIAGSGDVWFTEGVNTYADGEIYNIVQQVRLRDGRVWRSTTYFAKQFDPPEWRAGFVVPID